MKLLETAKESFVMVRYTWIMIMLYIAAFGFVLDSLGSIQ